MLFRSVVVGVSLLAVSASAVAAPAPQLKPPLDSIWNRFYGSRPWPTQFNWPPAGNPSAGPPGTCTVEQHAALEEAKDLACEDPLAADACKGNMSCELLQSKRTAIEACVKARVAVMDVCFSGGDARHWIAIGDLLGRYKNCDKCLAFQQAQQCRRPTP